MSRMAFLIVLLFSGCTVTTRSSVEQTFDNKSPVKFKAEIEIKRDFGKR